MKTQKSLVNLLGDLALAILAAVVQTLLTFDRRVIKRYLNLETPLYKFWWKQHVSYMQRKLEHDAIMRREYETGMIF